jgi:3-demethoxyubiquinol 3-hydroxylase
MSRAFVSGVSGLALEQNPARPTPPRPGAGESKTFRDSILRVDHAGELAAVHIYQAQAAVFGHTPHASLSDDLKRMAGEEQVHLSYFEKRLRDEGVRPTAFTPLWRLMATGLGIGTALLGEKAAHACTEAVETVIEQHYAHQIAAIAADDPELAADLKGFRDDELGHRDHAVNEGAHEAPAYPLLRAVIETGCRVAIKLSEKI